MVSNMLVFQSSLSTEILGLRWFEMDTDSQQPSEQSLLFKMCSCQPRFLYVRFQQYLVSVWVCWSWEYVTLPLPFCSNNDVIDLLHRMSLMTCFQSSFTSLAHLAVFSASSPQQVFTCLCKLPVDQASFVSRNLWIVTQGFVGFIRSSSVEFTKVSATWDLPHFLVQKRDQLERSLQDNY